MRHVALTATILFLLIISPLASAQTANMTAPDGKAIWAIKLTSPPDSSGSFIVELYNGDTYSGTWSYSGFPTTVTTVALEGDTSTTNYIVTGFVLPLHMSIWNADNQTSGVRKIKFGYGQASGVWNDYVEADISKSPIRKFYLTSDDQVTIQYEYSDYSTAVKNLNEDREQNILEVANEVFWDAIGFIESLFYWLKFFFIDGLGLILALFFSVSMVLAARAARGNIGRFFRVFLGDVRKLFEFMFAVWRLLLESIGTIRQWLRLI